MQRLGLDVEVLETGCCGMAGLFGFERGEKYRLSQQIGELDVLPKVRAADPEALLVSDGFSCREQIGAGAQRRPLHIAQVARLALPGAAQNPARSVARLDPRRPLGVAALALAGLGIGALLGPARRSAAALGGGWLRLALGVGAAASLATAALAASVPKEPKGE